MQLTFVMIMMECRMLMDVTNTLDLVDAWDDLVQTLLGSNPDVIYATTSFGSGEALLDVTSLDDDNTGYGDGTSFGSGYVPSSAYGTTALDTCEGAAGKLLSLFRYRAPVRMTVFVSL